MKKIELLIILLFIFLFVKNSNCQPYLITPITTPNGTTINGLVNTRSDYTSYEKYMIDSDFKLVYPNIILIDSATYTYNCHGYAWYSGRYGPKYVIDSSELHFFITDSSYVKVIILFD